MEIDRYKGGVIFKWLNKNEIYAKYNGNGRPQNLQAHIDKLHTDYIATRSGVDTGFEIHGLFGNIDDNDEIELLELDTIKKYVQEISKKNIDIFYLQHESIFKRKYISYNFLKIIRIKMKSFPLNRITMIYMFCTIIFI